MTKGSCLCGAIEYHVSGPMRPVIACHCNQCRKSSGHHVAATSAKRELISIKGNVTWYQSSDTARRGFCGVCGSQLFWDGPGSHMSIFAGTLDEPTGLKLSGHIFCADKGDYYDIEDGLPKADQDHPDMTTQVAP
ncbi:GFA family protein [Pseudaestuariivita rosea]|uniref:GFA family protein n=1 Tax=Pseudaestuariivita rosea TaxID=2763263 RepID=UPI001ABB7579|nr:GFA family protein [Pseudaestuariivita rosea]